MTNKINPIKREQGERGIKPLFDMVSGTHYSLITQMTSTLRRLIAGAMILLPLFFVTSCNEQKLSQIEEIKKRGSLRIITRNSPTTYYERADGLAGVEYELAEAFANLIGVKAEYIINDNLKEIVEAVNNGVVDGLVQHHH